MNQEIAGGIEILAGKTISSVSSFKKVLDETLGHPVTEIVNALLAGAINLYASDLHLEPQKEETKIRIRLDGVLEDLIILPNDIYETVLSRFKLLSGIKINVSDKPQDGRFSVVLDKTPIEIRASTLPTEYGETIVLRILNPKSLISIEELGLRKELLNIFKKEVKKPYGMIIVTGPTGSGKTTTLYSFLKSIQRPEIKIITIEDPIEYHLPGISQTQVNPGQNYDFATGLKAIVRQDPDVILVGEIRDSETADIAIQAALTGHLVFTTLHTNDAAGTVSRLVTLGAKPSNVGPALNMAVAQRLVRKVCKKCAVFTKISAKDLEKIKKELRGVKNIKIASSLRIAAAKGCSYCNHTGYRGRIGIFEALLATDKIEKLILTNQSIADLRKEAIEEGMITARQDGFIKVIEGVTTIEEIEKVTGE
ncbi:MAG: type II/IV secretion system protein [Candidatus Nealsonbacteria bacterium]|nr:type II/IV secretion system protein [Candidatus Nealsonbacteria bacterium]